MVGAMQNGISFTHTSRIKQMNDAIPSRILMRQMDFVVNAWLLNISTRANSLTHSHMTHRIINLTTNQRIGTDTTEFECGLIDTLCHFLITLSNSWFANCHSQSAMVKFISLSLSFLSFCHTIRCWYLEVPEMKLWGKLIPYLSCVWKINARILVLINVIRWWRRRRRQ